MKTLCFLLFLLAASPLCGQDLTGTWEGGSVGRFSFGAQYAKLVVIRCGNLYTGYTFDSIRQQGARSYCRANFSGIFNESISRLTGEGKGMIEHSPDHYESRFNLKYFSIDGTDYLEGSIRIKNERPNLLSMMGINIGDETELFRLKRTSRSVDSTSFMKRCLEEKDIPSPADTPIQQPMVTDTAEKITARRNSLPYELGHLRRERTNDTITTIHTSEKEITISIFDNGQVDGDTITVLHNNQVVVNRLGVTAKPYKFTIQVDEQHTRHEIVLIAHNVGSIPPNTARVIVEAGDKRYTLIASSDLKKNPVIIFEYRNE